MKLKTFKTLQYNITCIFNINSSNRMFCSMHNFISKTLSFNLCHCYLKCRRLSSLLALHILILQVRIHDIPKLSRNVKRYLISKIFWEHGEIRKITMWNVKISYVNCLITYIFAGLEHEKWNGKLILYYTWFY